MVAINLLASALSLFTAFVSARGSVLEMRARKHVVTLLYLRVPLFLVEFTWTVISTLIVFGRGWFNGVGGPYRQY